MASGGFRAGKNDGDNRRDDRDNDDDDVDDDGDSGCYQEQVEIVPEARARRFTSSM